MVNKDDKKGEALNMEEKRRIFPLNLQLFNSGEGDGGTNWR